MGPRSQIMFMHGEKYPALSNSYMMPVPGTFHDLPWACDGKFKVGEVLCEQKWSIDDPQLTDPRFVARKQLKKLMDLGYQLKSGWEEEFCIREGGSGNPLFSGNGYVNHLLLAKEEEFLYNIQSMLDKSGILISSLANEYAPGQYELVTHPVDGIEGADMAFRFKQAVKEICLTRGRQASFMTCQDIGSMACGRHYNVSLWNANGQNVFYDADEPDQLSEVALWWVGGVLHHARAITALCCPTVNCYRRLHQMLAPDKSTWAINDREGVLLRVKNGSMSGTYMECRLPSAACNPYLVIASIVAAGIDGIVNKITPPEQKTDVGELPHTLQEALTILEEDVPLVDALGHDFVKWFVKSKKQIELMELADCGPGHDTPEAYKKEREQYFEFI